MMPFTAAATRSLHCRAATSGSFRFRALRQTSFLPRHAQLLCPSLTSRPGHSRELFSSVSASLKAGESLDNYPEYFEKVKASSGSPVSLSSFKNKKPVVLFFYPKAGTPGCTKQAQTFRDQYSELQKLGAAVFGISGDSVEEQKAFAAAQNLPFPLLVDEGDRLRKGFGIKADLFGALPGRQTIVIDKKGTCILSYNDQFGPEKHAQKAIAALS